MHELAALVRSWQGRSVLVVGEAMLDSWVRGDVRRVSREAPVPIITLTERDAAPGGAANTAVNVAALGGDARFLSVIGGDTSGQELRRTLLARRVSDHHLVVDPGRRTLVKERVLAGGQLLVRVDDGDTAVLGPGPEAALLRRLGRAWDEADAVVVSDYGYGILTPACLAALGRLQRARPRPLVIDARELRRYRDLGVTAVKPNYEEACQLLGCERLDGADARIAQMERSGERLLRLSGARIAAVTLDTAGAVIHERGRQPTRTHARPAAQSRATGAGDTYAAALALALATGAPTRLAGEAAAAAAAVVVQKPGTAVCSGGELQASLVPPGKRLDTPAALAARLSLYHGQARRIVLTSGCFDILHRGHLDLLHRARALGDLLIVAVNSDESVRRIKGPERPLNPLDDRLEVLEGLACVDHVVPFEEPTPAALIRLIRPAVFAKGGDYRREDLSETSVVEAYGGAVRILPFVPDHSTTAIIERARAATGGLVRASAG